MPNCTRKGLFIFVEGPDDERWFQSFKEQSLIQDQYGWVKIIQCAEMQKKKLNGIIASAHQMGADYLFIADRDEHPCVTAKKEKLVERHRRLDESRIRIVVTEIEGWYLAGLSESDAENLGIRNMPNHTDEVTKEDFNRLIPSRFDLRNDFLIEVLKRFSFDHGRNRNRSFAYFVSRLP